MAWLLTKSFGRVAVTVAVTVAFVAGSQVLGTYFKDTTSQWSWLPSWLSAVASWLGQPPPPSTNYQAIVAAALAVTGTLAGVYFATVAFVVSTTYKDATPGVRSLVTRLPGGRVYTSVYVQAVLFGLITLALPLTGHEPNRLSLCVVTVSGGFVILSFGRLRTQLYGLLEPAGLLPLVQGDVARWTAQASRLARRDSTGSRIRLARHRTQESLLVLRDLCYLIRDRERTASNVPAEQAGADPRALSAVQHVGAVWLQYSRRKENLVQLSDWCPKRFAHKDWLTAADHEIGIALETATTLHPNETADELWVERDLAGILSELVGGREVPQLSLIVDGLDGPVLELMSRGMFAESRLWLEAVVSPARAATIAATPTRSVDLPDDTASTQTELNVTTPTADGHLYDLVDFVALSYTQAVLGLHNYAYALTIDFPDWMIAQAHGKSARHLGPIPAKLLRNLRDGLKFERGIEGRRITSDANITQLLARAIATEAIDEATVLLTTFEDDFLPWANRVSDGETLAAGAALSRLDEALEKWGLPLSTLSALFERCEAVHRDVDDQWPDLSLNGLASRRSALREQLPAPIARVAAHVDVHMSPDRPDVFGWAFYRAHQDLLDDVLSDRVPVRTDLEERLTDLSIATGRASRRIQVTVRRQHDRVLGSLWSEPMLMLLQLSGVALVIARAQQRTDLFDVFERVWRRPLDANPQRALDAATAALVLDDDLFSLSSGKINRSNRLEQIMGAFEGFGLPPTGIEYGDIDEAAPGSDTTLARMFRHVATGAVEVVFVAAWLIPEARKRGAVFQPAGLGPRLSQLIDSYNNKTENQAHEPTEPGPQGIEDDGES